MNYTRTPSCAPSFWRLKFKTPFKRKHQEIYFSSISQMLSPQLISVSCKITENRKFPSSQKSVVLQLPKSLHSQQLFFYLVQINFLLSETMIIHKQSVCLGINLCSVPSLHQGYVNSENEPLYFVIRKRSNTMINRALTTDLITVHAKQEYD